jgi:hypothetical protein
MKLSHFYFICIMLLICVFSACSDMNDLHDQYLRQGEFIYTGHVDSAKCFAGNNRILLRYWTSDPKAKKLLVYWSSRSDSLLLDIPEKNIRDSTEVYITNMEEGSYYFELFTFNKELKNRSVAYNIEGNVYGSSYQATLRDRGIKSISYDAATEKLIIYWSGAIQNSVGNEITYRSNTDEIISKWVLPNDKETLLENISNDVNYRTAFLPETNAIDTFYTDWKKVELNFPLKE